MVPLDQAKKSGAFSRDHEAFLAGATRLYGESKGISEMVGVLLLARRLSKAAIAAGLARALTMNSFRADFVEIAARSSLESTPMPLEDVPEVISPTVDLARYGALLEARP